MKFHRVVHEDGRWGAEFLPIAGGRVVLPVDEIGLYVRDPEEQQRAFRALRREQGA